MSEKTAAERAFEMPAHGEFCWTEIAADRGAECRKFYREVFGWDFEKSTANGDESFDYLEFGVPGEKRIGGLFEINPDWYEGKIPKPHMNVYIAVGDVDDAARRAFELGGTILGPPMDVPNVGRMCEIQDPTGAKFFVVGLQD